MGLPPGPTDMNPFIDAAMAQKSSLVGLVVRRLIIRLYNTDLVSHITAHHTQYFLAGSQPGVLQRVSLCSCHSCFIAIQIIGSVQWLPMLSVDRVDIGGIARTVGHMCDCPFASLFDTLGMCLADESAVLLLYTLVCMETLTFWSTDKANYITLHIMELRKALLPLPKDLYLHSTCLETLVNMAHHIHHLSAYASQRLVSLFYMHSRNRPELHYLLGLLENCL
ncbi:hypothetical protein NC652_024409 [Populus alba x Populus x berolinensis]|nr:hypothetical protein NC652_024409 [Populus alba x Populus x berolinensis]